MRLPPAGLEPRRDRLGRVVRSRPPEPRQPRLGQLRFANDRARRRRVVDRRPPGIRQLQGQRPFARHVQGREHRHIDRALAPAGGDRQCPRDRSVVLAGLGRTVFRGVVHPHRDVPSAVHAHRERQHRAPTLHSGIGHRHPGVSLRHRNNQCRRDEFMGARHAVDLRLCGIERRGQGTRSCRRSPSKATVTVTVASAAPAANSSRWRPSPSSRPSSVAAAPGSALSVTPM